VNDAFVSGKQTDGVVLADDIYVTPLGDSANTDDPDLARYLFIGDSISGNYDASLRAALKGRFRASAHFGLVRQAEGLALLCCLC